MLKYYVQRSASEDFQPVTTPPQDDAWICGHAVTDDELKSLVETYSMDANILRDVLDKNELPRIDIRGGDLYVFLRIVQRTKHGPLLTTPILLAVKGSLFFNVSAGAIDNNALTLAKSLAHRPDAHGLLLGTIAAVVSEYEILIQRTARSIEDTGRRLHTHEVTNEDFIKFVSVEDILNECRMNLNGMLVIAERILETLPRKDDREAVEDITLHIRQLIVAIESYEHNITSIRNAYSTIANNVLNQRMKTLTALTVLIALPNVFFGMYGMNVALPYQNQPWVYGTIMFVSLAVMVFVIAVARRKGIF